MNSLHDVHDCLDHVGLMAWILPLDRIGNDTLWRKTA